MTNSSPAYTDISPSFVPRNKFVNYSKEVYHLIWSKRLLIVSGVIQWFLENNYTLNTWYHVNTKSWHLVIQIICNETILNEISTIDKIYLPLKSYRTVHLGSSSNSSLGKSLAAGGGGGAGGAACSAEGLSTGGGGKLSVLTVETGRELGCVPSMAAR